MRGALYRTITRALQGAALFAAMGLAHPACAETKMLPPVGGVSHPAEAMIFYVVRGATDACGAGCSEWIAAEGVVQWDSYKRLLTLLDRHRGRKLPVLLKVHGQGNLNVGTTLGRIIRDRGLNTIVASTLIPQCESLTDSECGELKRGRGPLNGRIDRWPSECDVVCVLILSGGVKRIVPADTNVVIGPTHVKNRLAPNVSPEHQAGLTTRYREQYRIYLKEMGVITEVVDIIEAASSTDRPRQLSRADLMRLGIATD